MKLVKFQKKNRNGGLNCESNSKQVRPMRNYVLMLFVCLWLYNWVKLVKLKKKKNRNGDKVVYTGLIKVYMYYSNMFKHICDSNTKQKIY